jgi:hypothetical protein
MTVLKKAGEHNKVLMGQSEIHSVQNDVLFIPDAVDFNILKLLKVIERWRMLNLKALEKCRMTRVPRLFLLGNSCWRAAASVGVMLRSRRKGRSLRTGK